VGCRSWVVVWGSGACSSPVSRVWTGPGGGCRSSLRCARRHGALRQVRSVGVNQRGRPRQGGGHDQHDPPPTAVGGDHALTWCGHSRDGCVTLRPGLAGARWRALAQARRSVGCPALCTGPPRGPVQSGGRIRRSLRSAPVPDRPSSGGDLYRREVVFSQHRALIRPRAPCPWLVMGASVCCVRYGAATR
jgi:hypothetical protein